MIAENYYEDKNNNCNRIQVKIQENENENSLTQSGKLDIIPTDKNKIVTKNVCYFPFTIDKPIDQTLFLYYQISNFYQNDKLYISSRSSNQLKGEIIQQLEAKKDCFPIIYNKDLSNKQQYSIDGQKLDPEAIANPCGLIANSIFNDKFKIFKNIDDKEEIPISQDNISWPGDKGIKYKRPSKQTQLQWIDTENEHFINWMRTAGLPKFDKLWGKIDTQQYQFQKGQYYLYVENNFDTQSFQGEKSVYLTTLSSNGGDHTTLQTFLYLSSFVFFLASFYFYKNKNIFQQSIRQEQQAKQNFKQD